jgi:hypothetical protein
MAAEGAWVPHHYQQEIGAFQPFTNTEVDAIRTLVILHREDNEQMLLSCSGFKRAPKQTKRFIMRFKEMLRDNPRRSPTPRIVALANEDFIRLALESRKPIEKKRYYQPRVFEQMDVSQVPLRFRAAICPNGAPVRRSTGEVVRHGHQLHDIVIVPTKPPRPGRVMDMTQVRMLCAFFGTEPLAPVWVPIEFVQPLVVRLPEHMPTLGLTCDILLDYLFRDAHAIVLETAREMGFPHRQTPSVIFQHMVTCMAVLCLVDFCQRNEMPLDKVYKILQGISTASPFRYPRGRRVWQEFMQLCREQIATFHVRVVPAKSSR